MGRPFRCGGGRNQASTTRRRGSRCQNLATTSERFYRTVLSTLGVDSTVADAALVEWHDLDIGPTEREHPVTRALHVR